MTEKIYLTMPQAGETITVGHIIQWQVSEGDSVKEGDVIVELETEKAVFEFESPYEGKIIKLIYPNDSDVPVGEAIAVYEVSEEKARTYSMFSVSVNSKESQSIQTQKNISNSSTTDKPSSKIKKRPYSPFIRRLAREHSLSEEDLHLIRPDQSRLKKEDLLDYLNQEKRESVSKSDSNTKENLQKCSPIRLRIAENMRFAKEEIPHAHTTIQVDLTEIVQFREKNKKKFKEKYELDLSYMALVFPALKSAIIKHPIINSSFKKEEKAILFHSHLHLGLAVDSPKGLTVPVIHSSDQMSFLDFNHKVNELVTLARGNKLKPDQMTGLTLTLNNYGSFGTVQGVQIIVPPQAATLGLGAIQKKAWVVDDEIKIRSIMDCTLAFDHRVMDGREAGLFLKELKSNLENFSEFDLDLL